VTITLTRPRSSQTGAPAKGEIARGHEVHSISLRSRSPPAARLSRSGLCPPLSALFPTYGRLLLPDPQETGWLLKLAVYAAFRSLLLQGDLPQHLLHHLGKGPFTEAAYVYTRLLLEGEIPLRQTAGIRAMFQAAFQSAVGVKPQSPREMPSDQMLSM